MKTIRLTNGGAYIFDPDTWENMPLRMLQRQYEEFISWRQENLDNMDSGADISSKLSIEKMGEILFRREEDAKRWHAEPLQTQA